MDKREIIDAAIHAHNAWKQQLRTVIAGGDIHLSASQVAVDNWCEFGRWFYAQPSALRTTDQGAKIQSLHASFHVEAARILMMAIRGQTAEATEALKPGQPYAILSDRLIAALREWEGVTEQGLVSHPSSPKA